MIELMPTNDMDAVKTIAGHSDIWRRFSDGVEFEDYEPVNDTRHQWILITHDSQVVGVIRVYCESTCAIQFHPYMISEYRRYVREMTRLFYKWFLENVPKTICKINVLTPECFQSVINAARKMGFQKEGVSRDSYRLNDTVYNQIMSGITRKEVENVLEKS
tara:strand:- start:760 stop:1242 length:483 start_codon:yes stop_codon:yes gene_type:complete